MQPLKRIAFILAALASIAGVFSVGFYAGRTQLLKTENNIVVVTGSHTPADVNLAPFWQAWKELDERFIGDDPEKLPSVEDRVYGAISGLADSYDDPYTVFLPPAESTLFEEDISGNFGGVGMEIGIQNEVLTVISPLKDTPAEKAGIRAGDSIVAIDGVSTIGISVDEAVLKIRGKIGTPVTLSILREGADKLIEIAVVRDTINVPTLVTEARPDGIFVIQLFNFGLMSPQEFRFALREFLLSGSKKLVLDLRGNPGGFLQASVDIASWFLPPGKVVVSEENEEESKVHRSRGYNIFDGNIDMVILVDKGSASASEIVAGALRDHHVATIVGTQTFGKGSVQELLDIGSDSTLRITVAHWLTPSGESISKNGITPDVVVEITPEDVAAGKDPQLEKAVELLLQTP